MTSAEMAALHRAAFDHERPWTEAEFADLLGSHFVRVYSQQGGFALTRTVAGESELLTLAVHPDHRRRGVARSLLCRWLRDITGSAEIAFLEVAADNAAAQALYLRSGFAVIAVRPAYYARKLTPPADALVMQRALPRGQEADSAGFPPESS